MRPEEYRRHAAECLRIAEVVTDPQNRILLIHMAQTWLLLAQQIEKNRASNTVYEPSLPKTQSSGLAITSESEHDCG
jgi:hypothetical protein